MLKLKEEVGILAYLRRNGLENESNKYNSQRTIEEFQTLTSQHPKFEQPPEESRNDSTENTIIEQEAVSGEKSTHKMLATQNSFNMN